MHKVSGFLITSVLSTSLLTACSDGSTKNPFYDSTAWDVIDDMAYLNQKGYPGDDPPTYLSMSCSGDWTFRFYLMGDDLPSKLSAVLDVSTPLDVDNYGTFEEAISVLDARLPILLADYESLTVDYVVDGEYFTAEFDISDIESGFAKLKPNCEYLEK